MRPLALAAVSLQLDPATPGWLGEAIDQALAALAQSGRPAMVRELRERLADCGPRPQAVLQTLAAFATGLGAIDLATAAAPWGGQGAPGFCWRGGGDGHQVIPQWQVALSGTGRGVLDLAASAEAVLSLDAEKLQCWRIRDGEPLWRVELPGGAWDGELFVQGQRVFVRHAPSPKEPTRLAAYALVGGEPLWQIELSTGRAFGPRPYRLGEKEYLLAAGPGRLMLLEAETGRERLSLVGPPISALGVDGERVYLGTSLNDGLHLGDNALECGTIDVADGWRGLWTWSCPDGWITAAPARYEGVLAVPSSADRHGLHLLDAQAGKLLCAIDTQATIDRTPVVAPGGLFLAVSNEGRLFGVNLAGEIRYRKQLEERDVPPPLLVAVQDESGPLILTPRTHDGRLRLLRPASGVSYSYLSLPQVNIKAQPGAEPPLRMVEAAGRLLVACGHTLMAVAGR